MLRKDEWISITLTALLVVAMSLGLYLGLWTLDSILSVLPYFLVAGIVGVFLWGFRERIEDAFGKKPVVSHGVPKSTIIDPRFAHLTVHYSQLRDSPDTENPARPTYITDNGKKRAYRASDMLQPYIRQHKINFQSHESGRALEAYFRKHNIEYEDIDPLPEQIGLKFDTDGSLILAKDSEILSKLKDRKLDGLRIAFLSRFSLFAEGHEVTRTLLLKFSTKEAFESPLYARELIANGNIDFQHYAMRPWESCKRWSKRYGYKFIERRYTESELLGGV